MINTNQSGNIAYGVKEDTPDASGGVVEIQTGGTIDYVYGGRSTSGNATGNTVTVSGGTVRQNIFGGRVSTATVINNTATVSGGTVRGTVFGGWSDSGNATGNTVTVSDGTVLRDVFGGSSPLDSTNNIVTVSGGTVRDSVYGGSSISGNARGNTVTVSGGTVQRDVFGGNSTSGNATDNTVTVSGGTVGWTVFGGNSTSGNATGNTVTVSGGTVRNSVFGGSSTSGNATSNTVTVSGGTVLRDVVGGRSNSGNATNNTITISKGSGGNPTFGTNTVLYGGFDGNPISVNDVKTGNTLNMHTTGITVANIGNFENLNFYVQDSTAADATFLTLTDTLNKTDIKNTNIAVGFAGSSPVLTNGDKVVLIKKQGSQLLETDTTLENRPVTGMHGIAGLYDFVLKKENDQTLIAVLEDESVSINPQVKSLSEARLAGIDFVNRGADLAANTGLENLVQATQNGGIQGFAAIGGGKTRTQTGSHIDVNGAHLMLGVGTQLPNASGTLTLGGFVEGGKGSYDSYNDFANRPDVHASGDTHYYGVGLLAKQQFNNQWFIDGGLRLGKSHMDYYSSDLVDGAGNPTSFSGTSNYWGVNIGVGKDIEFNENNRLTPYAKLAYTHSSGDSQTIAGSTFDFAAINSLRSRLGVRWTHQLNETSQFYTDAAWEHEFEGTAQGQVLGFAMPEPSLQGDTGIVNIGVNFTPNENLTIGVGAQGEFGKRNGVSATAKVTYSF